MYNFKKKTQKQESIYLLRHAQPRPRGKEACLEHAHFSGMKGCVIVHAHLGSGCVGIHALTFKEEE